MLAAEQIHRLRLYMADHHEWMMKIRHLNKVRHESIVLERKVVKMRKAETQYVVDKMEEGIAHLRDEHLVREILEKLPAQQAKTIRALIDNVKASVPREKNAAEATRFQPLMA